MASHAPHSQANGLHWDVKAKELSKLVGNRNAEETQHHLARLGVDGLCAQLKTSEADGLVDEAEYKNHFLARRKRFGVNRFKESPPVSFWAFWWEALGDTTLRILLGCAVLSIALGLWMPPIGETRATSWIDGAAILFAVFAVSGVTAGNDFNKDRQFRALSQVHKNKKIKVIRKGQQVTISTFDVVVGDIVQVDTGDQIAADMILLSGHNITCDEANLTGEAVEMEKVSIDSPEFLERHRAAAASAATPAAHERRKLTEVKVDEEPNCFLLSGCMVLGGTGKAVVVAVGKLSQWGIIKSHLDQPAPKETPLQENLERLAEFIGKLGLGAAVLTLAALLIKWIYTTFYLHHETWHMSMLGTLVRFIIIAVTIIVVAVPEGLPLAVTLALAYSMRKMMADNNLVRHLTACETMGGVTQICSDKTGTLTQNVMTVITSHVAGQTFDHDGPSKDPALVQSGLLYKLLTQGIALNSTAYIVRPKNPRKKTEYIGPKTECALLVYGEKMGCDYSAQRRQIPVVVQYPFSAETKRMATVVSSRYVGLNSVPFVYYVKGAPEAILEVSIREMVDAAGTTRPLTDERKAELAQVQQLWAKGGLRTLALAYKPLQLDSKHLPVPTKKGSPLDTDLILLGLVGIEDPVRPEVPHAIDQCKRAGVRVRMLTGDNILTATSIAKQCGILTAGGEAIDGPKFRELNDEQLDALIPKLDVIARCSPTDKFILVKRLKKLGEVVAVTGDGTNDAPQLREADVGFAMGIAGTEVAKEASSIILLDDNFASIVKACMWGRNVNDSIRKFLQFQMTINIAAIVLAFVGAVTNGESPLKPVQLLWVNLIMDTMAALALATEAPTPELLDRPPYGRKYNLINWRMWRFIMCHATLQLIIFFALLYLPADYLWFLDIPAREKSYGPTVRNTIIFNVFVFLQVFNEFNARVLDDDPVPFRNLMSSWVFMLVVIITAGVQFLLVQFGGEFSSTVPLSVSQWLLCVAFGLISLPWGWVIRVWIPSIPESVQFQLPDWWPAFLKPEEEEQFHEEKEAERGLEELEEKFQLKKAQAEKAAARRARKLKGKEKIDKSPLVVNMASDGASDQSSGSDSPAGPPVQIPVTYSPNARANWKRLRGKVSTQLRIVALLKNKSSGLPKDFL